MRKISFTHNKTATSNTNIYYKIKNIFSLAVWFVLLLYPKTHEDFFTPKSASPFNKLPFTKAN